MRTKIAYDLDGVLYDTLPSITALTNVIFAERGYPAVTREKHAACFQTSDWLQLYRDLGVRENELRVVLDTFIARFKDADLPPIISYAHQALRETEDAIGSENIFFISNEQPARIRKRFERDNLGRYLDNVRTSPQGKTSELYTIACSDPSASFAYIGDLVSDGESCAKARAMGALNLRFYGITHSYAFNPAEKIKSFIKDNSDFAEELRGLEDISKIWKQ